MKKRKLNYTFHNPNSVEVTAAHLLEVFILANQPKVEAAIRAAAQASAAQDTTDTETAV